MKPPITSLDDWMRKPTEGEVTKAQIIVEQIKPLMRGHGPLVQSAVLADLTAMLLAGIQGEGKEEMREAMLEELVGLTRKMIAPNEAMILEATFGRSADQ